MSFYSTRNRSLRRLGCLIAGLIAPIAILSVTARADQYIWTGQTNLADWMYGANWLDGNPPPSDATTQVLFGFVSSGQKTSTNTLGNGFQVNQLQFTESGYTVNGNSFSLVGASPQLIQTVSGTNTVANNLSLGSLVTADVQNSAGNLILSGILSGSGSLAKNGLGTLTLTNASSSITGDLSVNAGKLAITSGGKLSVTQSSLGFTAGTSGTVDVSGAGSKWTNSGNATIGYSGTGTLNITGGGQVSNVTSNIGFAVGGTGSVTVNGNGSLWTNTQDLHVGNNGKGTLNIENGGKVDVASLTTLTTGSYLTINNGTLKTGTLTGNGTIQVSGNNSTLNQSGDSTFSGVIQVGTGTADFTKLGAGNLTLTGSANSLNGWMYVKGGALTIASGGILKSDVGSIGATPSSSGMVTVTGAGSKWDIGNSLYIGSGASSGTLNVTNAGTLDTFYLDGRGSDFLNITNGGVINCFIATIYNDVLSSATVSGAGTKLNAAFGLTIGDKESNTYHSVLALTNGGALTVGSTSFTGIEIKNSCYLDVDNGTLDTVTLTGSGTIRVSGNGLMLNQSGDSTFAGVIQNGVTAGSLTKGGAGTLTLTNAASSIGGDLSVNAGKLAITSGGKLSVKQSSIGFAAGASGTVDVSGAGSQWTNSGNVTVGGSGTGKLNITNGGSVSNLNSTIGLASGGTGTATVSGAGSQWTNSGNLTVGFFGTGTLNIGAGGEVDVANVTSISSSSFLKANDGTLNTKTLTGDGTIQVTGNGLTLNQSGNSTFAGLIQNGASSGSLTKLGLGTLTLTNTGNSIGGDLTVNGGTLAMTSGGKLSANQSSLGLGAGTSGTVNVNGTGSKWTNSSNITVGDLGKGILNITDGGSVSNASAVIGYEFGGVGEVTVSGAGSKWMNSGDVLVGFGGTGILNITDGGSVSNVNAHIGWDFDLGVGATVSGAGSKWTNTGNLTVGYGDTAILYIKNDGEVNVTNVTNLNSNSFLKASNATLNTGTLIGRGTIQMSGTGLTLNQSNDSSFDGVIQDGASIGSLTKTGAGKLTLTNGGTSIGGNLTITSGGLALVNNSVFAVGGATNIASAGTLTLDTGKLITGTLTGTGTIQFAGPSDWYGYGLIDQSGDSTFEGKIQNEVSYARLYKEGVGTLTLTNSANYLGGALVVNGGTIAITSGGKLSSDGGYADSLTSNPARILVSGTGSTWNSTDTVTIGNLGTASTTDQGVMDIKQGGTVNSIAGVIGHESGVTGTVNVTGAGSTWNNTLDLTVGDRGSGTLNLTNGGVVSAGSVVSISGSSYLKVNNATLNTGTLIGTGTIQVSGTGLTLNQSNDSSFNGTIQNGTSAGNLTKGGAGTLTLTGNNTYTGNTTVKGGTLVLSGGANTSRRLEAQSGATLKLTNGASLDLGSSGQIRASTGGSVVYDNASVTGGFLYGPGTQTVQGGGATFAGTRLFNSANLLLKAPTTMESVVNGGSIVVNSGASLTLDGFVSEGSGKLTISNGATMNASDFLNNGTLTIDSGGTFNNTGSSSLAFSGGSKTTIGTQAAPGGTLNTGGNDIDLNGGLLVNNGSITGGGTLNIGYGSTVKGSGSFADVTLNIGDGGNYSPGNSPGLVTAGGMIWGEGGSTLFEINDATGVGGTNWDLTTLSGSLSINAGTTNNSRFTVSLASLLPGNTAGTLTHFDATQNYSWRLVTASGGITGFDASKFFLDTSSFTAFNPEATDDQFSLHQSGNGIILQYQSGLVVVPENGTLALLLIGSGALGAGQILRRRKASQTV